jgi:adenosylcobinamide-GDP ribazoletransferase
MKSFLLALQFLTIIPVKIKEISEKEMAGAMMYFPFVGMFIGLALSGINALLMSLNFPSFVVNLILVIALIIITGGMHLDGLSDTADAFLSGKPKNEMLAIMRDPHAGVMGVLGIISVLSLKFTLISAMAMPMKATALILMCVLSRWSSVLIMFLFPYARERGKAMVFTKGINLKIFSLSSVTALMFVFAAWQIKGIAVLLITAGCAYLGGIASYRKINGITGDTLGAAIELTEIIVLFAVCIG